MKNETTPEPKMKNTNFPPKLSPCHKRILGVCYVLGFLGAIIAIIELCFQEPILSYFNLIDTTCLSYVGIGFALAGIIVDRIIRHDTRLHKLRLEDISVVKSIIIDAKTIDSKNSSPGIRLEDFEEKKKQLSEEVSRLIDLTEQGWTEYQILPIQKMIVDFRCNDELITSAQSTLADLQEYAEDSSYQYDKEYYTSWKQRIDEAKKLINKPKNDRNEHENNPENHSGGDISSYKLRSELKALIEHVTDYTFRWNVGSGLTKSLTICSAATIPLLIVSGIIPVLHPIAPEPVDLGFLSWGLLGTSGSLTAVILGLRSSDLVEVGSTDGKKEIWRAIIGSTLGFVSGILTYSFLDGGLISAGAAVPDMENPEISDISLMVLWAIGAGFSFEKIFDRFRTFNVADSS